MQTNVNDHQTTKFLETFVYEISPKLKEIDLLIKTAEAPLTAEEVSHVLDLSLSEVHSILKKRNISCINKSTFFSIMEEGSSNICTLYKREKNCGSPFTYTPENIAYIYDLDLELIHEVCVSLNIKEATPYTLPLIFSHIPMRH